MFHSNKIPSAEVLILIQHSQVTWSVHVDPSFHVFEPQNWSNGLSWSLLWSSILKLREYTTSNKTYNVPTCSSGSSCIITLHRVTDTYSEWSWAEGEKAWDYEHIYSIYLFCTNSLNFLSKMLKLVLVLSRIYTTGIIWNLKLVYIYHSKEVLKK